MNRFVLPAGLLALAVGYLSSGPRPATTAADPADDYAKTVRPLVTRYCQNCHSDKRQEADVNLQTFATLADVRKGTKVWQKVAEMLDSGQMPPPEAKQPTDDERTKLKTWVKAFLKDEARAHAGDPGRVVLRRLSNAEYTYTLRDLTGVPALTPAKEFPVDGAAGEGFTNTGNALVMSPTLLTKYLDAAKGVAAHAVLLPDGLRFSPSATRRDWTNEILADIRATYNRYTDAGVGSKVSLQGLVWDGKEGGRLPVEKYVRATIVERDAIRANRKSLDQAAKDHGLSAKYLAAVWDTFTTAEPSLLLTDLRKRWATATPDDTAAIMADIERWQAALWKFNSVGHIGKLDGPKAWLEPVNPLVPRQDVRFKLPPATGDEVRFYLAASDAGDGNDPDFVTWQQPKLLAANKPTILLKDVRAVVQDRTARRTKALEKTADYLRAAGEVAVAKASVDPATLAKKHDLDEGVLRAWLAYLGVGDGGSVAIQSHFKTKLPRVGGYAFINGWGSPETPMILANSSDTHVRIPGNANPHSVVVHPAPELQTAVGWQSATTATMRVEVKVAHAHPECGNGVTWVLEHRRGATRRRLAAGTAQGGREQKIPAVEKVLVRPNDLIALLIGPRDGNHACDLTGVNLTLTAGDKTWDLAKDVSGDILAGNPHADAHGNKAAWHFYTEPVAAAGDAGFVVPTDSILDRWVNADQPGEKVKLAESFQKMLLGLAPANGDTPDGVLCRQLRSLSGPLFGNLSPAADVKLTETNEWGIDPALFGKHPAGGAVDANSLCVKAPSVVEVRLPADLAAGYELVTAGVPVGDAASVQLRASAAKPSTTSLEPGLPVLVAESGPARKRLAAQFDQFRDFFPPAACYTKIVPVDEVVTLTLYYREDDRLAKLMLTDAERVRLDRLWEELHFVSQDALTSVDAFQQLMEFATQDSNPKLFEPLRKPIHDRAATFRKQLVDAEPKHLNAVLDFAGRAYRRPLTAKEGEELTGLYRKLRAELPHDEAIRLTLARVLVSPAFLYRIEKPGPAKDAVAVTDAELATRLSYFLWSSAPDPDLWAAKPTDAGESVRQIKRMLADGRTRRLATEFACQWLHVNNFDQLNEKSERHFPTFTALRGDMYEETVRFFTDFFQNDRSVLDLLDADHTFVNESLAKHYGIPGVTGPEWRRIDEAKKHGRGGILGLATTLTTQSGASRTSPILRGNWVSEVLLGEKLPRPPKDVPQLPDDESATAGLTVRQLVEKHTTDPKCAVCHKRIDAYGFALERYDAIGRRREKDLGDRPIDTNVTTMDGAKFDGIDGLRTYLLTTRKDAFVRQFCKKLLGYALGRGVQLSDEPLLDEMQERLKANGYRVGVALEAIVRSKQFREIRGSQNTTED